jgi:glyoxylase-like metal-dependent hydrolase (beta-lactamase superfamily II)
LLVDTGAGGFAPTNGLLRDNLRAEGVDLASIEMVVLTHAHPDHIGGNLDAEQRPAFANARYVLWRDEAVQCLGGHIGTLAIREAARPIQGFGANGRGPISTRQT